MTLTLVRTRKTAPIRYNDEYIEKMGRFFTSESFNVIYPHLKGIGFKEWLDKVYLESIEGVTRDGNR